MRHLVGNLLARNSGRNRDRNIQVFMRHCNVFGGNIRRQPPDIMAHIITIC